MHEEGRGVWIQKPKTERACLVSGVPCEMVVRGGGMVVDGQWWWWCSPPVKCVRWGKGFGSKNPKPSGRARFRVCRVKRRCGAVGGGGGVVVKQGWWWCGPPIECVRWGGGFGSKNPKLSGRARFWACHV